MGPEGNLKMYPLDTVKPLYNGPWREPEDVPFRYSQTKGTFSGSLQGPLYKGLTVSKVSTENVVHISCVFCVMGYRYSSTCVFCVMGYRYSSMGDT
jgi:hypothetical protein